MAETLPSKTGNFVSEWYGHRVFPTVSKGESVLSDQLSGRCPFLSKAIGEDKKCVKSPSSQGICTISSASNGTRQDWLVCPYRALDERLVGRVASRLFGISNLPPDGLAAAPSLAKDEVRKRLTARIESGESVVVFFQDKLGGEISISPTARSPELSFDITMVEVYSINGAIGLGRYGIFEVQTMDFHGSYRAAVNNLNDALRLHGVTFHEALESNSHWLSERIEGPNIANVFKRTFYQVMMKFQIGADESCAGCVLALPMSVWDSWQRHLGRPELMQDADGTYNLTDGQIVPGRVPAWIYLFELDDASPGSPNPIAISQEIATDAESVSYYALKVAPEAAVVGIGVEDRVISSIRRRMRTWWPELAVGPVAFR